MGAMSRRKGASWERDVATTFRERGAASAKRGLGQARCARECADVEGLPWWVECKVGARLNVVAALRQAREASDGRVPIVVAKLDRCEPIVTLSLADFLDLVLPRAPKTPGDGA
jgi:hypothetical protein